MAEKNFSHPDYVVHESGLVTTMSSLIGRPIEVHVGKTVFASEIISCVISGSAMTLEVSLRRFQDRQVIGLRFEAVPRKWTLFLNKARVPVDRVTYYNR